MSGISINGNKGQIAGIFRELVEDCDEAVRPAAQAGAQVLVDQVRRNVDKIGTQTGNLKRSIYQAYSKDNSGPKRAEYHVSWNAKTAPHGHLLEYGHIQRYQVRYDKATGKFYTIKSQPLAVPKQVPAKPFVRPAAESHGEKALNAMADRMAEEIGKRWGM